MPKSKMDIINEIVSHIADRGGGYADWYAGITENPKRRIFEEHGLDKEKDIYICRETFSSSDARDIENYILNLGCNGGTGGGGDDAVFVYAYKKSYRTDP